MSCEIFRCRNILFHGTQKKVMVQSKNGPCPLIAIVNALILRGVVHIRDELEMVDGDGVVDFLMSYLLKHIKYSNDPEVRSVQEHDLAEIKNMLPNLLTGVDVNVKHYSCDAFEFTPAVLIFDYLGLRLLHGWVVHPDDKPLATYIGTLSYNEVVDRIVSHNAHSLSLREHETQQTQQSDQDTTRDTTQNESAGRAAGDVTGAKAKAEQDDLEAHVLGKFLEDSSTQLTLAGLCQLSEFVKDSEICVFFRNNHFMTMYSTNGYLYCLASDFGYFDTAVVWERLDDICGDQTLCGYDFRSLSDDCEEPEHHDPPVLVPHAHVGSTAPVAPRAQHPVQTSHDARIASDPTPRRIEERQAARSQAKKPPGKKSDNCILM